MFSSDVSPHFHSRAHGPVHRGLPLQGDGRVNSPWSVPLTLLPVCGQDSEFSGPASALCEPLGTGRVYLKFQADSEAPKLGWELGVVARAHNPSTWQEAEAERISDLRLNDLARACLKIEGPGFNP